MTETNLDDFVKACSDLVGRIAVNPSLANAIVAAVASARLTPGSGPMAIGSALKGFPGGHELKAFLNAWQLHAAQLDAEVAAATLKSALSAYLLAQGRDHSVDTVWTGPEVEGSEVRRTEAVVKEIIGGADSELLIVGYWLVASTAQIRELVTDLRRKANAGVDVRFVFDPGEKSRGADNFSALAQLWPGEPEEPNRRVYTWNKVLSRAVSESGDHYDRKLHAKVIVADRHDALVTSANLTHAGLLENLEMGLRVQGPMARAVVKHFDLLIDTGVLERR